MGLDPRWNIRIGRLTPGPRNLITDVPGVAVGHATIADGPAQTGVTAVVPAPGNLFRDKVMAACHVINGFGKSAGLVQVAELGTLETPLLLTNTLSVGTALTALVRRALAENPEIGDTTGTVNGVVFECNDGLINDIRALAVREEHAEVALAAAGEEFAEGAVGAGRGMKCHEIKGGIGSASRRVAVAGGEYTIGALLLTNHALLADLVIDGDAVGRRLASTAGGADRGSVITILATDLPLTERQLGRLCRRVQNGLARTGSYTANGSGEIALAFTTAHRVPHSGAGEVIPLGMLHDDDLDRPFRAVAEVVEESVLSSMLHAEPMPGRDGVMVPFLADLLQADRAHG